MARGKASAPQERKNLNQNLVIAVLTEAGYRCAFRHANNPGDRPALFRKSRRAVLTSDRTCWTLCPTCHALYYRGTIKQESIYAWRSMLVAISRAFDVAAIDQLLFLANTNAKLLAVSGGAQLCTTDRCRPCDIQRAYAERANHQVSNHVDR